MMEKEKKEDHIDNYFTKEDLGSNAEEEEDSEEWFIEDEPPSEDVRVVFLRPGKKEDEENLTSQAS